MGSIKNENMEYEKFALWLDNALWEDNFEDVFAFNFNLYEGVGEYNIELIGSDLYDPDDSDWACSEVFTTRNSLYIVDEEIAGANGGEVFRFFRGLIEKYLAQGQFKDKLLSKQAVAMGFIDADLMILHEKE